MFGNYSYYLWQGHQDQTIIRRFRNTTTKQIETIFDQEIIRHSKSQGSNIKAGMDFYASKKTTLGVVFSGYINPYNSINNNQTDLNNATTILIR